MKFIILGIVLIIAGIGIFLISSPPLDMSKKTELMTVKLPAPNFDSETSVEEAMLKRRGTKEETRLGSKKSLKI